MEYDLEPCPYCRLANARLKRLDQPNTSGNCLVAAFCSGCGARGPVRHISPFAHVDAVMALAADDWNMGGQEGQIEHKVENMPLRIEALDDVLAAKESESEPATGSPNTPERPAIETESNAPDVTGPTSGAQPCPDPANNGAGQGGAATEIDRGELAKRAREYLKQHGLSQTKFAEQAGSRQSCVSALLQGAYVAPKQLAIIDAFLDSQTPGDYDESKIERLPNNYDKLKSGNPLPKYDPPARHSRAP